MIDLRNDPPGAPGALRQHLKVRRPWVVVLGDPNLADAFEGFATGPNRRVILAPATSGVRAELLDPGSLHFPSSARAVSVSARTGRVVDFISDGEQVDNVRIVDFFAAAES